VYFEHVLDVDSLGGAEAAEVGLGREEADIAIEVVV
jgi:hypothetical protein